jgi:hypothetical protein
VAVGSRDGIGVIRHRLSLLRGSGSQRRSNALTAACGSSRDDEMLDGGVVGRFLRLWSGVEGAVEAEQRAGERPGVFQSGEVTDPDQRGLGHVSGDL